MTRYIKHCRHEDAAVKCEYKEWIWSETRGKAVRLCSYSGVCAVMKGGEIKNGKGEGGEKLLH